MNICFVVSLITLCCFCLFISFFRLSSGQVLILDKPTLTNPSQDNDIPTNPTLANPTTLTQPSATNGSLTDTTQANPTMTSKTLATLGTGFNNTCLREKKGLNRDGPRNFDCPGFVIQSTDQIWNMYRDPEMVRFYLRRYMAEDWESISPMGEYLRGYSQLESLVLNTLAAFPDIRLHIVDAFCEGNDIDGYRTTMPVIHTATHSGAHPVFGTPTNRSLTWYGVPNSFVRNVSGQWKYTAEINMPDTLSLYSQLGLTKLPEKSWNVPTDDCNQLFDWDTGHINPRLVPSKIDQEHP